MKKIVSLPNTACAQLEGKSLYIYDTNDNVELRLYCSDYSCSKFGSWHGMIMHPEEKVVDVYKDGRLQKHWIVAWDNYGKGVYIFRMARVLSEHVYEWKRTWFYYEWLNAITPFSPGEIGWRLEKLRKNPWSYGLKAILR